MTCNPLMVFTIALLFFTSSCSSDRNEEVKNNSKNDRNSSSEIIENSLKGEAKKWSADFLTGKFDPAEHPDFVEISSEYASRHGMFLQKEVYEAFLKMHEAAKQEGVELVIRSATRNFDAQKIIWEEKWEGLRPSAGKNAKEVYPDPYDRAIDILLFSSMPGTSRHHWGTDIDLNSFDNSWFEEGEGLKLFLWLEKNAPDFGFCRPYTPLSEERTSGYQEEKWHWSYLPLSAPMTLQAGELLNDSTISGFLGSETAIEIGIVQNYVLGIHPSCIKMK